MMVNLNIYETRKPCEGIWWKTAKYKRKRRKDNRKCSLCGNIDDEGNNLYELNNGEFICIKCYNTILRLGKLLKELKNNCDKSV